MATSSADLCSCEEVVDAAFSYLQFPKLRSACCDSRRRRTGRRRRACSAMQRWLTKRTERSERDPSWFGSVVATGPEEIDLGAGAYLLSATYARNIG